MCNMLKWKRLIVERTDDNLGLAVLCTAYVGCFLCLIEFTVESFSAFCKILLLQFQSNFMESMELGGGESLLILLSNCKILNFFMVLWNFCQRWTIWCWKFENAIPPINFSQTSWLRLLPWFNTVSHISWQSDKFYQFCGTWNFYMGAYGKIQKMCNIFKTADRRAKQMIIWD